MDGWTDGQMDGRTDELIWGGLGNLWFLQVKCVCCLSSSVVVVLCTN